MCLATSPIAGVASGLWESASVVFDTIVPSQRPVVGGKTTYDIDVRQFVVTENNAVIRRTLEKDVSAYAALLDPRHGAERLRERGRGCFDFRARAVVGWVLNNIRYLAKRGRDPWQFPDETVALMSGDCEDIAFLAASLLLASGVSGYHVRVALGTVQGAAGAAHDHAWVLYKSESGAWRLIEPLAVRHAGVSRAPVIEPPASPPPPQVGLQGGGVTYQPSYLFNADHLWAVPHRGHPGSFERIATREWKRMSPKFAGDVHQRIVESALEDIASAELMTYLRGRFRNMVVATVDESDWVDPPDPSKTPYNPLDHFDNGCIDESWALVETRLEAYEASGRTDHERFAQAIHGIADFYAHSSYGAFGWLGGSPVRTLRPYPGKAKLAATPDEYFHDSPAYGAPFDPNLDFDFDFRRFSKNRALWTGSDDDAVAAWDGRLISGRYAQSPDDAMGSFVERNIEELNHLPPEFATAERGALPHHDEIAVDAADPSASHRLFRDVATYRQQFQWRVDSAVRHIRDAFSSGRAY
ncbi:MAG TPA: transglutaminase domain-containing protein [Labilithrix sp.]|nr:transglutaminase domain-containing protein [Labilithrix sp.]